LRTVLWQFAGERLNSIELGLLDNICEWLELDASSSFRNRLSSLEISALIQRIDRLKKEGFPYPSEDWPAIPWPPV